MGYSLEQFCQDTREALTANPGHEGRDMARANLEKLLVDPDFLASTLGDDQEPGVETIYEDPDLKFCVLAYLAGADRTSPPHDHGVSWAVYGQAEKHTDMQMYQRVDGGAGAGEAKLELIKEFRLNPGQAGLFDVGEIHAIDHPKGARFVRVTGEDLNHVERLRFDAEAGTAEVIEDQGVPHPDKA
ncbi:MAG: hypothetical protein QF384_23640 [Alphaproteobacteria bacterium]|jgi:hypothetical protein|nr:hypothetical protein [Alphaproteobacteria bacterium]MDP6829582.1 hypothetical protein [Alphaproteobacteria bacterium]